MKSFLRSLALAGALDAADAFAATFTVTNTNVTGAGSLQQALWDANTNAGPDLITFSVPGDGPHIISPTVAQPLPALTDAVTIDGYTQTDATPNTLSNGFNGVIKIQIDGTSAGAVNGITLLTTNSVVRGLSITRFGTTSNDGIGVGGNNNVIEGNLIGLNPTGSGIDYGNNRNGIIINGVSGNRIGGTNLAERNVISDNSQYGVLFLGGGSTTNNLVQGNIIGLSLSGARDGNTSGGVRLLGASRNTIGGNEPGARNVISGNAGNGILIEFGGINHQVIGNFIGTDVSGSASRFNGVHGIYVDGVGTVISNNTIAFNSSDGVYVFSGTSNSIRGNAIFSNTGLGIDLDPNGVTANDAGDADAGPNNLQNFPVLTNAIVTINNVAVQGTLNSRSNTTFQLDFYVNAACDAAGNGEGQTWLTTMPVTTDASSNASFSVNLPTSVRDRFVTVTATDPDGNSSEFSACFQVTVSTPPLTFIVTNTADSGPGSLRQALLDVDLAVNFGSDTIAFNIPGGGVQTISPHTALPTPLDPVTIDGYTQPGTVTNSLAISNNAVLLVQLDGSMLASGESGLSFNTSSNIVRGLILTRFPDHGVTINGGSGTKVEGNFIGTDATTILQRGNHGGVHITGGASNSIIGGTVVAAQNLIAYNTGNGVWIDSGNQNAVLNNLIVGNTLKPIAVTGGTNAGLQPPLLQAAVQGSTSIRFTVVGIASSSCLVEVFAYDSSGGPTVAGKVIKIGSTTVTIGASGMFTGNVTLTPTAPTGSTVVITATMLNNTTEQSTPSSVQPPGTVDLVITKTVAGSALLGSNITFTIVISNNSPITATSPAMNDVLPLGVTFVSATPAGGSYTEATRTYQRTLSSLTPSGTSISTITVVSTATGSVTNTVTVTNSPAQNDPVQGNNSASAIVNVTVPAELADNSNANTDKASSTDDPISTFTGELFELLAPDLDVGGPMRLFFNRYYASLLKRDGNTGRLGDNWRHNFEITLTNRTTTVEIVNNQGRAIFFTNIAGVYSLMGRTDIPFQLLTNGTDFILGDPRSQRLHTFNSAGRLTQIEDGHGNTHTLAYTGNDLTSVSDGLGRTLTFQYSGSGFLTNVSDGARSVVFTQSGGNLASSRDPLGLVTTYAYDLANPVSGLLTAKTMPEGNVPYSQTFDSVGRVISQTEAGSNITTLAYAPNLTTITNPLGNVLKHAHTGLGAFTSFTDEENLSLTLSNNAAGQRIRITDRLGNVTSLGYHTPSGYVSGITNADGTFTTFTYMNRAVSGLTFFDLAQVTYPDGATEQFTYDASGNVLTRTDRAGKVFTFTYNARGQVLTAQNPLGGTVTNTYHADGTLASRSDTDTGTTTFAYDSFSRLTNIVHPDGTMLKSVYDANDRVTTITDERNNTYTFTYDDNGNVASVTDPLSQTAQFAYDTRDRVIQTIDRLGRSSRVTYDQLDHLSTRMNRNGNITRFIYDTRRRLASVTDPGNQVWSFGYDNEALLTSSANPLNQTNRIRRDALGYETGFTNALNQSASLVRDTLRRVTATVDALQRTNGFGYDSRGLLTNSTKPVVGSAAYERNPLGLLSRITDLNGSQWNFGYTPMGRAQFVSDPLNRTNRFAYDNRGRPLLTTFADGTTRSNSYDQASNPTRRQFSDGTDLQYSYDALNRLVTANDVTLAYDAESRVINTTSSGVQFGAAYDAGGRLTNVTYNAGAFAVTYTYDNRDRLVSVSDSLTGTTLIFTYDNAGRLTGVTRPNGVNGTRTYDAAGRLTRIQEGSIVDLQYALDAAGQVTNVIYTLPLDPTNGLSNSTSNWTHDGAHQINNAGYNYDARGRLTNAPGQAYQYDAASRLKKINAAQLGYNGFNDVITRAEAGTTNRYFYNHALGMNPIVAEKNENTGQILRYYIWSPGGRLLYLIEAANGNAVRHFHFDRVGSTLALTDAAGAVTDSYAYTPYGELLGRTGTSKQPFTFIGRYGVRQEPVANLFHMRARYYDPVSARFLSTDPIWPLLTKSLEFNPYQYAVENPLLMIDPSGLMKINSEGLIEFSDWDRELIEISHRGSEGEKALQRRVEANKRTIAEIELREWRNRAETDSLRDSEAYAARAEADDRWRQYELDINLKDDAKDLAEVLGPGEGILPEQEKARRALLLKEFEEWKKSIKQNSSMYLYTDE